MTVMDVNAEHDLMKLLQLVIDLSEQLDQTKQAVVSLHAESQKLKVGDATRLRKSELTHLSSFKPYIMRLGTQAMYIGV